MSEAEATLKTQLLQLKCHFTWELQEKDTDIEALEIKLDNTDAIANLQKAEKENSEENSSETRKKRNIVVIYANYAWINFHQKEYEQTQIYIVKINSIYQESKGADLENLGEKGWALLKFSTQYSEKAKECFEKVLEGCSDDRDWISAYVTAMFQMGGFDFKKYIEQAQEQAPKNPSLLFYAAVYYTRRGKSKEAHTVLEKAVSVNPNSSTLHHGLGLCYTGMINEIKKTAEEHNEHSAACTEKIKELSEKGKSHFEMALKLDQSRTDSLTDLADLYIKSNQYPKAEETYKKALTISALPGNAKQQIHLHYGNFLKHCKKSEEEAAAQYKAGLLVPDQTEYRASCEISLKQMVQNIKGDSSVAAGVAVGNVLNVLTDASQSIHSKIKLSF
ncbi:hypothetical protein XELAEV_18034747mg [Xenopus laevis]|uniref:Uncharacterized protein n=1 Tax=Xenopus laevis TaxID=8355 RepID=A0A974CEI7_XENLA|nr:hypothetical protein XELAEV_18034747mg [Xenopus laevis]